MQVEKFNLSGKTALVTGASQGIGEAIAKVLADAGAKVVVHYHKNRKKALEVVAVIRKDGGEAAAVQADFTKRGSADKLYGTLSRKKEQIDILVINASVQVVRDWDKVGGKDFDRQVDANFRATLQLMQLFFPAMVRKQWGRILTIGSVQQVRPHPSMIVYAATKSAVRNLIRNVAMQLADKGVTVNNLAPGVIETPRIKEPVPENEKRIMKRMETPMERIGQPEDCAGVALLLCSDAGRFITGQNIYVDGGMSL